MYKLVERQYTRLVFFQFFYERWKMILDVDCKWLDALVCWNIELWLNINNIIKAWMWAFCVPNAAAFNYFLRSCHCVCILIFSPALKCNLIIISRINECQSFLAFSAVNIRLHHPWCKSSRNVNYCIWNKTLF